MKEIRQLIQVFEDSPIEKQVKIREKIYDLKKYIDQYFDDNLYVCSKCWKHFPIGTATKKFESWTQDVCKNPYGGYMDRYEYEQRTYSDFRYYCPICGEKLPNHYQNQCYSKGKKY